MSRKSWIVCDRCGEVMTEEAGALVGTRIMSSTYIKGEGHFEESYDICCDCWRKTVEPLLKGEEGVENTCEWVLDQVRRTLKTPSGLSVIERARKVMEAFEKKGRKK